MFTQLLNQELKLYFKQTSFLIIAVLLFGYGSMTILNQLGPYHENLAVNSPYRIMFWTALCSMSCCLLFIFSCSSILLKDKECGFDAITGNLAHKEKLISRLIALFTGSLIHQAVIILGMAVGSILLKSEFITVIDVSFADYLIPWILFSVINSIIFLGIMAYVTLRWETPTYTAITGMLLFLTSWSFVLASGAPISGESVMKSGAALYAFSLLDPSSTVAFFSETQFFSIEEKNQSINTLGYFWLTSRLVWVSIALLALYKVINSRLVKVTNNKSTDPNKNHRPTVPVGLSFLKLPRLEYLQINNSYTISRCWQSLLFESKLLLANRVFWVAIFISAVVSLIGLINGAGILTTTTSEFSSYYPSSSHLLSYAFEPLGFYSLLLVIFFSAEIVWRAKRSKFDNLVTPASTETFSLFLSKLLPLLAIPFILVGVVNILSVIMLLTLKNGSIDWVFHFSTFYWFALPLVIKAIVVFFIMTICSFVRVLNYYSSILISTLVLVIISNISMAFSVTHPLLQVFNFPSLVRGYSQLVGFAGKQQLFDFYTVLWGSFAIVTVLLSHALYKKQVTKNKLIKTGSFNLALVLFSLIIVNMVFVNHDLETKYGYQSAKQKLDRIADYERQFAQFATIPVPHIMETELKVDIYPESRRYTATATNLLVNRSEESLDELFISSRIKLIDPKVTGATLILESPENYGYLFKFDTPLKPSQKLSFSYTVEKTGKLFANNNAVTPNGSYINLSEFEPLLGYAEFLEISDPQQRKVRGLPEKVKSNTRKELGKFITNKRMFSIQLSTSSSNVAITSGELVKTSKNKTRNVYYYQTQAPVYPQISFASGEFIQRTAEHNGIEIELYFDAKHDKNTEEIFKATKATLDYGNTNFSEYPFNYLRLIEVPDFHPFGGKSTPGMVALTEGLLLQNFADGAAINNVARNVVHEVAHQWWGEKLTPELTSGDQVLLESLAKYTESQVIELIYGADMKKALLRYNERRYHSGRAYASAGEPALVDMNNQRYLSYGKGPLVFDRVKVLIGEDELNRMLKAFVANNTGEISGTLQNLVQQLSGTLPTETRQEIKRLFMTNERL